MTQHTTDHASRCQYRTSSGRQCRFPASSAAARLCPRHKAVEKSHRSADLAAALAANDENTFQSAENINRSLARLFTLLASDRISPRRAAVLAYIGSLLLRSLPAMEEERAPTDPKKSAPTIIWDMPRPAHEHPAGQDS